MSDQQLTAYCMKCKTQRDMANAEAKYTRTGQPGTRGECPVCGTKMFKMGETPAHANVPKPEKVEAPKRSKKKSTKSKKRKTRKRKTGKLVIVESPAKATSVGRYLGKGYTVKASKGHVRDLLKSRLSVDVENGFEPEYRVLNDKRTVVKDLKLDVEGADEVYLATDPDREGEAIAWHLIAATEIDENTPLHRVVFNEITKDAVKEAFENTREINMDLVNAQQARRILDRLVGYKITPLLWQKVLNNLSAGRVQSIALRLISEREAEIESFITTEYWSVEADLSKQPQNGGKKQKPFTAKLLKINGENFELNSEDEVLPHIAVLEKSSYQVGKVKRGTRRRRSAAPYTTSTMQQEVSRRLGYSTNRTMQLAQRLYEGIDLGTEGPVGLITYMRTDSTNVSKQAQEEARGYIEREYGKDFRPDKPPVYKTKSKGAQEAHEAIRPTSALRTPDSVSKALLRQDRDGKALLRLYTLIWQRFVASQMSDAIYNTLRVDIEAGPSDTEKPYLFRISGSTIKFKGFLALYEEAADEDATADNDEGRLIPEMTEQEMLNLIRLNPEQHFTQPPPRYTEASLIKTLEEYGIGRPSTYAPTVRVIQDRSYVDKQDKRLIPTDIGRKVINLLVEFFPEVLDYSFTAKMEDQLDDIAEGHTDWRPMLMDFYKPFEERLENAEHNMPDIQLKVGRTCPTCETGDLIIKSGRFGMFIGCTNYPDCKHTERYVEHTGIACPTCGEEHGGEIVGPLKTGRGKRPFYGCSRYPDCDYTTWKLPKTAEEKEELQKDAS
jgi:DNA topoisomerase-1